MRGGVSTGGIPLKACAGIMEYAYNGHMSEAWITPKQERPKCGAKTRTGRPCMAPVVWDKEHDKPRNGRCRMHGGLSTGAKSVEGRIRSLANLKQF